MPPPLRARALPAVFKRIAAPRAKSAGADGLVLTMPTRMASCMSHWHGQRRVGLPLANIALDVLEPLGLLTSQNIMPHHVHAVPEPTICLWHFYQLPMCIVSIQTVSPMQLQPFARHYLSAMLQGRLHTRDPTSHWTSTCHVPHHFQ